VLRGHATVPRHAVALAPHPIAVHWARGRPVPPVSHARLRPLAGGRCRPPGPSLSPPLCSTRRRWDFLPPLCFLLRSDASPAVPSLTSASSHRTTDEDAATPPEPPSIGMPLHRPLLATPPPTDLLGEPCLRSSCPAHKPCYSGALTENLAAGSPPPGRRRARHRTVPRAVTTLAHAQRTGHLRGCTGPPGRGPTGLLAGRACQAATPRTIATGRILSRHCAVILNYFSIV
jgi:hypothetical protein